MAAKTLVGAPSALRNVVGLTNRVGPCSVFFQRKPSSSLVKAQATGDNKDSAVDVQHVASRQGGGKQSAAVERRPRRLAADISPFGEYFTFP